jgi:hypothetical protein
VTDGKLELKHSNYKQPMMTPIVTPSSKAYDSLRRRTDSNNNKRGYESLGQYSATSRRASTVNVTAGIHVIFLLKTVREISFSFR